MSSKTWNNAAYLTSDLVQLELLEDLALGPLKKERRSQLLWINVKFFNKKNVKPCNRVGHRIGMNGSTSRWSHWAKLSSYSASPPRSLNELRPIVAKTWQSSGAGFPWDSIASGWSCNTHVRENRVVCQREGMSITWCDPLVDRETLVTTDGYHSGGRDGGVRVGCHVSHRDITRDFKKQIYTCRR